MMYMIRGSNIVFKVTKKYKKPIKYKKISNRQVILLVAGGSLTLAH